MFLKQDFQFPEFETVIITRFVETKSQIKKKNIFIHIYILREGLLTVLIRILRYLNYKIN